MIRLLALRAFIASLKSAIAISNEREPSAWMSRLITLAVLQGLLFALALFHGDRQPHDGQLTRVVEVPGLSSVAEPAIVLLTDDTRSGQESGGTLVYGTQVLEIPLNNRSFLELATRAPGVTSTLADEITFCWSCVGTPTQYYLWVGRTGVYDSSKPDSQPLTQVASSYAQITRLSAQAALREASQVPDPGLTIVFLTLRPPPGPQVMPASKPEPRPPLPASLPLWALFVALAFNGCSTIIAGVAALISHNREKADQVLRAAQLRKIELEIDQLRRQVERDAQEAWSSPYMPWV